MFNIKRYKSISEREDKTNSWWKKEKIFERSVEERPEDNQYSFLDGPPFVTGMPHYGHLAGRIAKDVIPRYQTMKGKRVRRVWGWDCHGIPVEEKVEKKLKLKNKRDIERLGKDKFLKECYLYVEKTSSEWEWYVDKIGEWIDFKNAYKTMNKDYMESVIWVFKQLYDKGLVYQGNKTLLYCTRCGTPVSKFEIAMDDSYKVMQDPAVTIEFPVASKGEFHKTRLLAWTTTPWTLPANRALVIEAKEKYVLFVVKGVDKKFIAAKKRIENLLHDRDYEIKKEFKGKKLLGLSYKAPYEFFPPNKNDFKVYEYEGMVNMDEGTGIVHNATSYGEIDAEMGREYDLTPMYAVDDEGKFIDKVSTFKKVYVKDADKLIIKDLEKRNLLFKKETISHRYPYCYRCETPLIYRSVPGWFIKIQKDKNTLLKQNKKINWVPNKLTKRFEHTIKTAPDWNISRTRYWATAIPIWKCSKCNKFEVFGSIKEIEERSGQKVNNLHIDGVDHIKFDCKKCSGEMERIPEVLDVWFESGSMPYGQIHYPFKNMNLFRHTFPADYIAEYVAQIRAWFYYMHVVSNLLLGKNSFLNVVNTGTLAGTDGRKMSKSYGNYPDPKETLEKYGGDALRLYFMSSPLLLGEDPNMNENEIKNQVTTAIFPLWNSVKYFGTYANLANWEPKDLKLPKLKENNNLDLWILSRMKQFANEMEDGLDAYNMPQATRTIAPFINDLSTWYIRRSRDRFVKGDKDALTTLYYVLVETSKVIASLAPFIAEEMYQSLVISQFEKEPDSIHLCFYPEKVKLTKDEKNLLGEMKILRNIASLGQAARVEAGIKVRQPLEELLVNANDIELTDWMKELLTDELNLKRVTEVNSIPKKQGYNLQKGKAREVALNTKISLELKQEGLFRELVRTIQNMRKKMGYKQEDLLTVTIETKSHEIKEIIKKYQKEITQQTNSKKIALGKGEKEILVNKDKLKIRLQK